MANVLADLAVESEAATAVAIRLAGATDRAAAAATERKRAFRRLALAATKYWVCKRAPAHAAEALECLGGNGYVEESGMPRLYREAPLAVDLGGLRQRRRARRAARPGPPAGDRSRRSSPRSTRRPARTGGWTPRSPGCGTS